MSTLRSGRRVGGWGSARGSRPASTEKPGALRWKNKRDPFCFSLYLHGILGAVFHLALGASTGRRSDRKRWRGVPVFTWQLPADQEAFGRHKQQEQDHARAHASPSDVTSSRCPRRCWEELLLSHAWKVGSSKCLYIHMHFKTGGYAALLSSSQGRNRGERCCVPGRCWLSCTR